MAAALLAIASAIPITQDTDSVEKAAQQASRDSAVYLIETDRHPMLADEDTIPDEETIPDEGSDDSDAVINPCDEAKEAAKELADGSTVRMLVKMMKEKIAALKAERMAKCSEATGWFKKMTCHAREVFANIKAGVASIKDEFLPAIKAAREAKAPLAERVKELGKACLAYKLANPTLDIETSEDPASEEPEEEEEEKEEEGGEEEKDEEIDDAVVTPCDESRAAVAELADGSIIRMLTTMMHDKITALKAARKAKCDAVSGFFQRLWCHGKAFVANVRTGIASIRSEFMPAIKEAWAKKAELRAKVKALSAACVAHKVAEHQANPSLDVEVPILN
jgi:hypothetical protein